MPMLMGYLISVPLIFSLLLFAIKDRTSINGKIALVASLLTLGLALWIARLYLSDPSGFPVFHPDFFHYLGIEFKLSLDGLSLLLLMLTTFLFPLIIYSGVGGEPRRNSFYALMLLMEMALIGVFTTTDILLFYIFWELALIPIFFIAILWGGDNARAITFKFFLYTLVGGLIMLAAIIALYVHTGGSHSFAFADFYRLMRDPRAQIWILSAFFVAFAIKIPIFPFHTWQPDLYQTAPTQGTMLLAGIMLKMGIYGLFRFVLPLCPDTLDRWGFVLIALSVTGIIYASIIAIRQNHLKRLIAYSSLAHVGLISAGLLTRTFYGMEGAMFQMISHGINIVGLFICYEFLVRRTGTGEISSLGGIASNAPVFATFFMIILLGSISLPLTNSFIGEFLLLMGLFQYNPIVAAISGLSIIFGAVYMLRMFQRVMYGPTTEYTIHFKDLNTNEVIVLIPIVVAIIWLGLAPGSLIDIATPAVRYIGSITMQIIDY